MDLPRILLLVGLVATLTGLVDPLEGWVLILPGIGMVTVGAVIGRSRHLALICSSLVLAGVGVAAMLGLSAVGGLGRAAGRSFWWGVFIAPYPIGWLMGIIGAVRALRERATVAAT